MAITLIVSLIKAEDIIIIFITLSVLKGEHYAGTTHTDTH